MSDDHNIPPLGDEEETKVALIDAIDALMAKLPEGREITGYCVMFLTLPEGGGGMGEVMAMYQIAGGYSDQLSRMLSDFEQAMAAEKNESEH